MMVGTMESVYFYEEDVGKKINNILQRDFQKVPYVVKGCELLGSMRRGYFLYIRARSEAIDRVEERLKKFGVIKILGEEKKPVCRAIIADEIELAALGFRSMFKDGEPLEEQ